MAVRVLLTALLLTAAGCANETSTSLVVDVETDFVPELEFRHVETELEAVEEGEPAGVTLFERRQPSFDPAAERTTIQVADFGGVRSGTYRLTVRLRAVDGFQIASKSELLSFVGTAQVARVVLSRGCAGVFCPGPGDDAEETQCRRGECVPERCTPEDPTCVPECVTAAECGPSDACAEPACVEGECLATPVHSRCGPNEWCDPDVGCRMLEAPCSEETCVGAPCEDAQCVDGRCVIRARCAADQVCCADTCAAPGCDDGDACTEDACGAAGCEHRPLDGVACDDGAFCNGSDACVAGACAEHAGDPCAGASVCDEVVGACVGCDVDADCGPPVVGPTSPCDYADVCDERASATRPVTSFTCEGRVCTPRVSNEAVDCTRNTNGIGCGAFGLTCFSGTCRCPTGVSEDCTDGVDNDCDGQIDCLDPSCAGQPCDDGDACTGGETCAGGACGGGAPGRPVRRCAETSIGMYLHVTDGPCPSICGGLVDQGIAFREVPGQSAPTYQVSHNASCPEGGEQCNPSYWIHRMPTAGDGFYCDAGGISSAYASTMLPGTQPIYRYTPTSGGGQFSGLEGTQPAGYVRFGSATRYACPP